METTKSWSDLSAGRKIASVIGAVVQLALAVTAWKDLAGQPAKRVNGRKVVWAWVIAINYVGPIAYFIWGRKR